MKMDMDRHGPRPMPNSCKNLNPPNFSLPSTFNPLFSDYIVPLPNNQFMYTNIVILLPILYQSFMAALYYSKLFGINIYVSYVS